MSYTDYLRRKKINTPQVIDTQMRMPDASSFTWRTKLAATRVNQRSAHVINNTFDPSSTPYLRHQVLSYPGNGFGGKVQDASSYTLSLGATSIGKDNFTSGRIVTNTLNAAGGCLTRPPASQVVSEAGNAEESVVGLNMGYVTTCNDGFYPLTKSHFVDTIPDLKTRKIGVKSRDPGDGLGRQIVQNTMTCTITDTVVAKSAIVDANGINLAEKKSVLPYNSYSAPPNNEVGSPRNLVHGAFITSRTGLQTGGGNTPGSRAPIVGGVSVKPKGTITHRGWATPSINRYPHPFVPPNNSPAHLRLNGPIFGTRVPKV
jgi:hypothetical protein